MLAAVTATTIYGQAPEGRLSEVLDRVKVLSDILTDKGKNRSKEHGYANHGYADHGYDDHGYDDRGYGDDGRINHYANHY